MIPILFDSNETEFTSNGLGRLADCLFCTVTEERNGIYECQFTYPITGVLYSQIQEGCILGVIHDDVHDIQPFDIYARSAPINGVVTFYAHHISYRLGNIVLRPMSASSCAAAFDAIPRNTYNLCPFTFWTDKSSIAEWTVTVPSVVRAMLSGQQGSILDVYGKGDYEFDKWTVKLYLNRGADRGVSIRYGVNLTDITQDYDISAVYTAVVPYWLGQDGELVTLPEGYVAREDMAVVPAPLDLSAEWEEAPTVEQLRAKATSRLNSSQAWLPKENIRVSFVDLAHTADYQAVSALQQVSLCDQVSVYYGDLDVNAVKMKVVRVVFNVLTEMYDEIELGDAKSTLAQTIASQFEEAVADLPTTARVYSMLTEAVDSATAQITGAMGGFVRFLYDANGHMTEIVIMDTDDIETATRVWRWNSGGLGYSSHGYGGPYGTAITQDGSIVADFITAGIMNANLIRTGIITSPLGGSWWNLDTGVLMIGGMSATDIAENVGKSVVGIDIEYAQNQSSSEAPTSGWSTVAPPWAAGWYIWQRTKTTTPDGIEYSDPTCISGRDGSSSTPGLNQATLYLYQRSATQPAKPSVQMVYTFADGSLTNIPAGWSRSIPSGSESCWVTSAAAISTDTSVTLTANAWQDAVMMAANGAAIEDVVSYFATSDSTIPPETEEFIILGEPVNWVDNNGNIMVTDTGDELVFTVEEAPLPTKEKPYVWTFQRTTYSDGTVLDSTKSIIGVLGADGVGVEDIVEQYYLSTSESSPTGGRWTTEQPEWESGKYLWTRTKVTWTDGAVTTTEPILAKALNAANEAAAAADAKANSASAREQLIYHSAASGTISMPANTTWVTASGNTQNAWTTTRPVYSSSYPVLFVATQRQSVEQRSGTTCSCTTPVIDQTTTVIDGGHISTGTIDAGVVNVTNIKAGNITSGTLNADRIGAGAIDADKLAANAVTAGKIAANAVTAAKINANAVTADKLAANAVTAGKIAANAVTADKIAANAVTADKLAAAVITSINNAQSTANSAVSAAGTAQSTANSANNREQLIYHSAPSGTSSMAAPTSWVTASGNTQNAWTTRRPVYSASYPVLFVATQRQTVGGTVTCTTPVIDQTTTVIDGGHITTGTIDAGVVNVTNIKAGNITSGTLSANRIGANSIAVSKLTGSINGGLSNSWEINLTDGTMTIGNISAGNITTGTMSAARIQGGTLTLGGDNNVHGKIVVQNAFGDSIGVWDKDGIDITAGSININRQAGTHQSNVLIANSIDEPLKISQSVGSYSAVEISVSNNVFKIINQSNGGNAEAYFGANGLTMKYGSSAYTNPGITLENTGLGYTTSINSVGLSIIKNSSVIGYMHRGANDKIDFYINGTKSRVVATDQYADRLLYCYETPSPMFGDIGEGTISEDGLCYVWLDPVFAQTITTAQYQVFLQRYGDGDCYVKERRSACFVVSGTPGLAFGWEIKAKQRDYDQRRLEHTDEPFSVPVQPYGEDAATHIDQLRKDRVSA